MRGVDFDNVSGIGFPFRVHPILYARNLHFHFLLPLATLHLQDSLLNSMNKPARKAFIADVPLKQDDDSDVAAVGRAFPFVGNGEVTRWVVVCRKTRADRELISLIVE